MIVQESVCELIPSLNSNLSIKQGFRKKEIGNIVEYEYPRPKEKKKRVDWHRVVCWGGLAQTCRHLSKGDQVAVFGKLRTNRWEDAEGKARRTVEVVATDIGFLRVKSFAAGEAE